MHLQKEPPEVLDGFELCDSGEPFGGYSYVGAAYVLALRYLEPLARKLDGTLRVLVSASAPEPRLCAARILRGMLLRRTGR